MHISLLLGGSECAGFKCDVGDGWVGGVAVAFEVAGDAVCREDVVAVEYDGVCWWQCCGGDGGGGVALLM